MAKSNIGRVAILVLLLIALAIVVPLWMWRAPGPLKTATTVSVAKGSTVAGAARTLEEDGVIRSASWFRRLAARLGSRDPIRAGEFAIPARVSAARVLDILQHARPMQHFVVIPEGMPALLVQRRLLREPLLTGSAPLPAEGSVLPDSYAFERGEKRTAVLARMTQAMDRTLARLWQARKPGIAVASPRDALVLASIVEKETGLAAERRTVAAVYSNRLRIGMALQADPTVIYPITRGLPLGRRILRSELEADNGYNTYARPGLPTGPIANPGREAIAAVLDPARSSALYFVADGKGGHVFADTLAQHEANVKKWYAIRKTRGEM